MGRKAGQPCTSSRKISDHQIFSPLQSVFRQPWIVRQIKSFERLTAQAALNHDYATALMAMTINPQVMDENIARQILDEMLKAHRQYLPGWTIPEV